MFYYSLSGYEENTIIQHKNKFTLKKFESMCEEAPRFNMGSYEVYDSIAIYDYLIEKYLFEPLKITARMFCDGEIGEEINK